MRARENKPGITVRVESGAGRTEMTLPVKGAYSLDELIPRRQDGPGYRVRGEVGPELAAAFGRVLAWVESGYGTLSVSSLSRVLTPRWQRVLGRLKELGFARTLYLSLPFENGVPLYYFDIASPFHWHETDGSRPELPRYSRGFSDDYDTALARVVGECLERSALLYYRMQDLVRASPRSLRAKGKSFLEPARLSVFSAPQIERAPERRFSDDSVFGFAPCTSLVTGETTLVPAQLLYWNYAPDWGDAAEPVLRERSTHGAGGYYSIEGAALSGLLECVQRDGFFLHWMRSVPPKRIDLSGVCRASTVALIDKAKRVGLKTWLFDITSEIGIPTCLAALVREDGRAPFASVGGSTRLDGETAIHDALLEAASVHHVLVQRTERFRLKDDYEPFTDPTLHTHNRIAFWANPEHARHLDFLFRGEPTTVAQFCRGIRPSQDARESLSVVVDRLRRLGFDAFYFQAEHPGLRELGYASVRVITPDLLPLYYEERNAPLGLPRLRTAPLYAGLDTSAEYNFWPHPFP
jgi:ribosomal protein S12 methylthiotransferase accessory factor